MTTFIPCYSRFDGGEKFDGYYATVLQPGANGGGLDGFFCFFSADECDRWRDAAKGDAWHYPDAMRATRLSQRLLRPNDHYIPVAIRHLWP